MKVLPLAILCGLFCGPLGVFCVVWTVLFSVRGELLNAVVTLGVSAFCFGFIIPFFKVVPQNISPRVEVDDAGTTFRPDRGIDIPVQVSLVGLVVASALIAVLAPLGRLDIPVPPFMRLSLPILGAVIVAMGAPLLWRNVSRGGTTKYLRLTPQGYELSEGFRSASGDWAQVEDVSDEVPGQQAPTPGAVAFVMSDDSVATIAVGAMTPDGSAMRDLVRFYWEHPGSRGELTDGRVLKRLAA